MPNQATAVETSRTSHIVTSPISSHYHHHHPPPPPLSSPPVNAHFWAKLEQACQFRRRLTTPPTPPRHHPPTLPTTPIINATSMAPDAVNKAANCANSPPLDPPQRCHVIGCQRPQQHPLATPHHQLLTNPMAPRHRLDRHVGWLLDLVV